MLVNQMLPMLPIAPLTAQAGAKRRPGLNQQKGGALKGRYILPLQSRSRFFPKNFRKPLSPPPQPKRLGRRREQLVWGRTRLLD